MVSFVAFWVVFCVI